MKPERLKVFVEIPDRIPLRIYKGWEIIFNTRTEKFESPLLCLFGCSTPQSLEEAIDYAIARSPK